MNIGSVTLSSPVICAPMAGYTHLAFRLLARELGAGLVCSEMISAQGLVRHARKTLDLLDSRPEEKPVSVQIFGREPETMARAAALCQDHGADIVDINFGCAVKKIVRHGGGVALMQDMDHARRLLTAVRQAVTVPLTIKMRTGWDPSGNQALDLCRLAEDTGVDAVTLHPRTARQAFSGTADWSLIARAVNTVSIPVIGNGDIKTAADGPLMFQKTGCRAVMIGRAATAFPWIFAQIKDMADGRPPRTVTPPDRHALIRRYIDLLTETMGEFRACLLMRNRLPALTRGLPRAKTFRDRTRFITSRAQAVDLVEEFFRAVEQDEGKEKAGRENLSREFPFEG